MSQKVKYRFEFEVSDSWKAGESACWTECPFSPLIGLGHTCKFLTTKELKCPFRDNKFKTLIERDCTVVVDGITISENFAKKRGDEMTDNKIIRLFERLKRQQAEIKELKIENQSLRSAANSYKLHYNEARAEAVKEFAERLKDYAEECKRNGYYGIGSQDIDDILKKWQVNKMSNLKYTIGIKRCDTCEQNLKCQACVYIFENIKLREDVEHYKLENERLESGEIKLAKQFYKQGVKDLYTKIRTIPNDKILVSDIQRIIKELVGDEIEV